MKIKLSLGERIFQFCNTVLMILICIAMIYPILYVVGRSFMEETYLALHPLAIIPKSFSLEGYKFIFSESSYISNAYMITVLRTIIGTLFNILLTSMMAYTLSKKYYPGRKAITFIVVFTMWFGGGMISTFLLVRSLGLLNSFWVYVLPEAVSAWNLILLRNFYMSVPAEIEESARIDGANDVTIMFRIYLPLSTASIATVSLFYSVGHWNAWFDSLMYTTDRKLWTLQLMLKEIVSSTNVNSLVDPTAIVQSDLPTEIVKYACIVVATVPILCLYPFLQKHFVKGVMVGSLKG